MALLIDSSTADWGPHNAIIRAIALGGGGGNWGEFIELKGVLNKQRIGELKNLEKKIFISFRCWQMKWIGRCDILLITGIYVLNIL